MKFKNSDKFYSILFSLLTLVEFIFFTTLQGQTTRTFQEIKGVKGDTLKIGEIFTGIKILNPIVYNSNIEMKIAKLVYGDGLVYIGENNKIENGLAISYTTSRDELEWTFVIRSGIKFHDGKELTVNDVIFTFDVYRKLKSIYKFKYDPAFDNIAIIRYINDYTIKFTLRQKNESFIRRIATMSIIPKHIFGSSIYSDHIQAILNSKPVGLGPFKFYNFSSDGKQLALIANENYYKLRPFLDGITFKFYPTEDKLMAAFITGEVDFMEIPEKESGIRVTKNNPRSRVFYTFSQIKTFYFFGYNNSLPLFNDRKVRQALSYAINREAIINRFLKDKVHVTDGPVDSDSWIYYSEIKKYEFNPLKSLEILKDTGFKDGDGDGILEMGDKKLSFTILFEKGSTLQEEMVRMIQVNLGEIGINVNPIGIETDNLLKRLNERDYEAVLTNYSYQSNSEDICFYELFYSSNEQTNIFNYNNREINRLVNLSLRINDSERLKPVMYRLQLVISQDMPCTFLFFKDKIFYSIDSRFRNYRTGTYGDIMNPFEIWYVPLELQKK